MIRNLDLTEIERLLHETMPEPEATRWRYETIVALVARVRELELGPRFDSCNDNSYPLHR